MKKMPVLICVLLLTACQPETGLRDGETGKNDSLYYQSRFLTDSSDATLLEALYQKVLERPDGLAGLYTVFEQPTTRLEPYPPDSALAHIHQRCNYTEKGVKKQLVILKLENTSGTYYSNFHFVLLDKHPARWIMKSVWYDQLSPGNLERFALHKGETDSLELDLYLNNDSILKSYRILNDVMTENPKRLLDEIKGRKLN